MPWFNDDEEAGRLYKRFGIPPDTDVSNSSEHKPMSPSERGLYVALGIYSIIPATAFGYGVYAAIEAHYWWAGGLIPTGLAGLIFMGLRLEGKHAWAGWVVIGFGIVLTWSAIGYQVWLANSAPLTTPGFTQAQVDQQVAEALAPLRAQIAGNSARDTRDPSRRGLIAPTFKSQAEREEFSRQLNNLSAIVSGTMRRIELMNVQGASVQGPDDFRNDAWGSIGKLIFDLKTKLVLKTPSNIFDNYKVYNSALADSLRSIIPDETENLLTRDEAATNAVLQAYRIAAAIKKETKDPDLARDAASVLANRAYDWDAAYAELKNWAGSVTNRIQLVRDGM